MTMSRTAKSTAGKVIAGGIPGALIGSVICENFAAIQEILNAVIATLN